MTTYPHHMNATEKAICNKLLAAIIATEGLFMRVYDGEEWATEWTRDLDLIRPEIAATEETRIYLMDVDANGAATRLGSILLIHGNDEDVISDSSWNPKAPGAEHLVDRLCAAANA